MKKFCVGVFSVWTPFTHSFRANENRNREPALIASPTSELFRSISLLAKTRLHLLRRTHRPNRHHANRVGGEKEVDQPIPFFARAELLHAPARPGGAAARH